MELDEILDASIQVGYELLRNGAEIYRVEQSIMYICGAYGVKEIEAFAIPSSIVVTVSDGHQSLTKSKRVQMGKRDLDKISRLTDLSRCICREHLTYQESMQRLLEIKNGPVYSTAIQYFAYMVVGLSFTMFFGGKWQDGLIGAGVGAQIYFLLRLLDKIRVNGFFVNIICGFVASVTARLLENTFSIFNSDVITIGTIMLLVPGLAIANSMRDFISSDTMAGMSRLIEALFVATGIAIGVAFAMMVV